jgi:hypothetical protein
MKIIKVLSAFKGELSVPVGEYKFTTVKPGMLLTISDKDFKDPAVQQGIKVKFLELFQDINENATVEESAKETKDSLSKTVKDESVLQDIEELSKQILEDEKAEKEKEEKEKALEEKHSRTKALKIEKAPLINVEVLEQTIYEDMEVLNNDDGIKNVRVSTVEETSSNEDIEIIESKVVQETSNAELLETVNIEVEEITENTPAEVKEATPTLLDPISIPESIDSVPKKKRGRPKKI